MNLWDRCRKWAWISILPVFLMCEDPNEIGTELNPNSDNVNTLYKEFTLPTSIVFSDSVRTSEDQNMAFGVYEDPIFGRIESIAYFQFGAFIDGIGPQRIVDLDAIYDSAILVLQYNFFYGEDFTQFQRLRVHEITDTLFNRVIYKSNIRTPFSRTPIGEAEFRATPGIDSLLFIDIDDEYGERALDAVRNRPINDGDDVLLFEVPGIALVPDDNMDYIVGVEHEIQANDSIRIEESSTLRIYYHSPSFEGQTFFWDYPLQSFGRYMLIENDRSSSELSGLTEPFQEFVPATDDRYVQPITGIHTKIDMSPVWDFIDSLDGFIVNKADFEITPVNDRGGTEDFLTTINQISLLFTDESNKINGNLINTTNNLNNEVLEDGSYTTQFSPTLRIAYDPERSLFRAEISNYLQAAGDNALDRTDLMIFPVSQNFNTEDVANQFDQLVFDKDDLRIKLFYTTLQ